MSLNDNINKDLDDLIKKAADNIPVGSSQAGWAILSKQLQKETSQTSNKGVTFLKKHLLLCIIIGGLIPLFSTLIVFYGSTSNNERIKENDRNEILYPTKQSFEKKEEREAKQKKSPLYQTGGNTKFKKQVQKNFDKVELKLLDSLTHENDSSKMPTPYIFW